MQNLYKLSMGGAFQDVDAGRKAEGLQITFALKVRDSAELKIEDLINAGGGEILMQWSKDIFEIAMERLRADFRHNDLYMPLGVFHLADWSLLLERLPASYKNENDARLAS